MNNNEAQHCAPSGSSIKKTPEELLLQRQIDNLFRDMAELKPYLEDDSVTDIAIVDSGELIVTRFGAGKEFTGKYISESQTERIIKSTATIIGRPLQAYTGFPILEGVLPKYNARITGLMPPNCIRPELQIRKPPKIIYSLEDYLEKKQLTKQQYKIVCDAIKNKANIMVAGTTGSGKTTFTNAVIQKMSEYFPDDNFYIVEDTPELQCSVRMKTMLWINKDAAAQAVEESLRFTPDRIIFGEVRTSNVMYEVLDAWRTHSGGVSTIHAKDASAALSRIKSMASVYDQDMSDNVTDIVNLIVHLKRTKQGIKVDEIMQL